MAEGRLQRELKKKRPFESAEEEALLNLWRTHDRFQIRFARFFREFGLTSSQYNVLRILRGEGKPLPCLEIADRLITAVPAITGLDRPAGSDGTDHARSLDRRPAGRLRGDQPQGPRTNQPDGRAAGGAPQADDRPSAARRALASSAACWRRHEVRSSMRPREPTLFFAISLSINN